MRITFILPEANLSGGVRVVAIYAERLQQRGHDVTIVSAPPRSLPLKGQIKSFALGRGWPGSPKGGPSHLDGIDVKHHVIDCYRPLTDGDVPDADVIIATWWETAEWVAGLSSAKGAKAYFIQHHEVVFEQPVDRVNATYNLPLVKITISKWLQELMRDEFGDDDVAVVKNSVDTEMFFARARDKQSIPTVGMLYAEPKVKGCDVSLKALDIVRESVPELQLVAFGQSTPSKGKLPTGTSFTLKPPQDTLRDIYASCDIWLCGSRAEGYHLPPLEAMACRCPVVSTKVGGPTDIIEDDVNGYLVDVEDHRSLADRMLRIIRMSPKRWREMSDAAYETVRAYSWDDATDLFEHALVHATERAASHAGAV
ncbi:MAG: glycosyltransferase family 4 protein [Pirellulales bacterium]|nr:glycosyltransferase family 4 protein [Pirellulales bacterium]